jgi:hypothetical protein
MVQLYGLGFSWGEGPRCVMSEQKGALYDPRGALFDRRGYVEGFDCVVEALGKVVYLLLEAPEGGMYSELWTCLSARAD